MDPKVKSAFDEWIWEQEGYGLRWERAADDLTWRPQYDSDLLMEWLQAAFKAGYEAAKKE